MTANSPSIRAWCLHCGQEYKAQRASSQFCSDAHRKAYSRLHGASHQPESDADGPVIPRAERPGLLDRLATKLGIHMPKFTGRIGWSPRLDDEGTHTMTIGNKPVGYVSNKHPGEGSSWHAVHREEPHAPLTPATVVGPSTIHELGICRGRATMADAKRVAEALATGDFHGLILDAWDDEDNTDDIVLTMKNLPRLLRESASPIPIRKKGQRSEEAEEFNTEERLLVRLAEDLMLVQGDDSWLIQRRIGYDRWRQEGSYRTRAALVQDIRRLVGDVSAEVQTLIDALR